MNIYGTLLLSDTADVTTIGTQSGIIADESHNIVEYKTMARMSLLEHCNPRFDSGHTKL